MSNLISFIDSGQLRVTPGGIHPPTRKQQSISTQVARLALPEIFYIPLKQHIGEQGQLLVSIGDHVLKGQALTQANLGLSLPVHAPTSGTIIDIRPHSSAHPSALPELTLILKADGDDRWYPLTPLPQYQQIEKTLLIKKLQEAGIAGMGGAGFPSYIKAAPRNLIKVLIINGVECEPYITADDMLMRCYSDKIIEGIKVLQHLVEPERVIIAIEDDKSEAIAQMQKASLGSGFLVRSIPTKYPSGGEKQLIQILTGQEIPSGKLPSDIGILSQNIGTAFAIGEAILFGKPLIERIVTVTGDTLGQPQNVWALLGTPIRHLLHHAGFVAEQQQRVIMGGPMMGFTLPHLDIPIIKTSNCILAPTASELPFANNELACIRCSACADACPASLLPQQLQWYAKAKDHEKALEYHLFDCIECGACAYVCPSEIPLVQYYRVAKAEIRLEQEEQRKAEQAKMRFEARKQRLEQESAARKQRQADIAATKTTATPSAVQDALLRVQQTPREQSVTDAIARAKAKAAQSQSEVPDNSEMKQLREARKEQARLKREQNASLSESGHIAPIATAENNLAAATESNTEPDPRKAAVAAAIARAKAKKAEQQQAVEQSEEPTPLAETSSQPVLDNEPDPRKAAVAAAIARAKAKKAEQQQAVEHSEEPTPQSETSSQPEPNNEPDPRKAAVAAAIARAKAKKAEQQQALEQSEEPTPQAETSSQPVLDNEPDPRKAAVAAAIARAKAKKAAQLQAQSSVPHLQVVPTLLPSQHACEPVDESKQHAVESELDPRKAAIARAVAQAKAKAKAKQDAKEQEPPV